MKYKNPFDSALDTRKPSALVRGALVDIADTVQYGWDAARAIFEDAAKPEHAIEIAKLMHALLEKRQKERTEDSDRDD